MGGKSIDGTTVIDERLHTYRNQLDGAICFSSSIRHEYCIFSCKPMLTLMLNVPRLIHAFATIARPTDAVMTGVLDIHLQEKTGYLTIMMPYATMDTVKMN